MEYNSLHPFQVSFTSWIWNKKKTIRRIRILIGTADLNLTTVIINWVLWPIKVRITIRIVVNEPEIFNKSVKEIPDEDLHKFINTDSLNITKNLEK